MYYIVLGRAMCMWGLQLGSMLEKMEFEEVGWIRQVQDSDQWRAVMSTVICLVVLWKAFFNFLNDLAFQETLCCLKLFRYQTSDYRRVYFTV
jgi:hypothetical protein